MEVPATGPLGETQVKYQSPYGADPAIESSLKRRLSSIASPFGEDQKKQRLDPEPQPPHDDLENDDELARIIAQATASATESLEQQTAHDAHAALGGPLHHHHEVLPDPSHHQHHHHQHTPVVPTPPQPLPPPTEQRYVSTADPNLYMRIMSLPILESLSTQIISTIGRGSYDDTIKIITSPDSERAQAWLTLRSLFDQTKKLYTEKEPFLSARQLGIREPKQEDIIRLTNVAIFGASVFGGQGVSFYELNDNFLETFVPINGELNSDLGKLYINLKTQMYLSAMSQEEPEKSKEETLQYLFPHNIEPVLLDRHPGSPLTSAETSYISEAQARRQYLQTQPEDADTISQLSEKFAWEEFLRALAGYFKQAYEPFVAPYMQRHGLYTEIEQPVEIPEPVPIEEESAQDTNVDDIVEQAARAAQVALQSVGYGAYPGSQPQTPSPYQNQPPPQHGTPPTNVQRYASSSVPYPTQSAPTQVLYEQARQAAVAKSSSHNRRPGLPSQRRPWTPEEENALMAGLDQVKGPHWSQILALYGPNGQVNEILKDRNQVQLKDKARNLKLFFLKSNIEVPYYLQCVTGELKTRAPSQAARKEAEERARLASEEEQARFNGIMALAGGMQTQPQVNGPPHRPQEQISHSHPQTPEIQRPPEPPMVPPKEEAPQPPPQPVLSYEESLGKQLMADIQRHDSAVAVKAEPAK